jgi:hypothetical protein
MLQAQAPAELIEGAGGYYVEAAIMTSVLEYGIRVPVLLGGPRAARFALSLRAWGMNVNSNIRHIRGHLSSQNVPQRPYQGIGSPGGGDFHCGSSLRCGGCRVASLGETFPGVDWERQGAYLFERVIRHGKRRSEEMYESAATIADTGIGSHMATAAAQRQRWLSVLAGQGLFETPVDNWRTPADAALGAVRWSGGASIL